MCLLLQTLRDKVKNKFETFTQKWSWKDIQQLIQSFCVTLLDSATLKCMWLCVWFYIQNFIFNYKYKTKHITHINVCVYIYIYILHSRSDYTLFSSGFCNTIMKNFKCSQWKVHVFNLATDTLDLELRWGPYTLYDLVQIIKSPWSFSPHL